MPKRRNSWNATRWDGLNFAYIRSWKSRLEGAVLTRSYSPCTSSMDKDGEMQCRRWGTASGESAQDNVERGPRGEAVSTKFSMMNGERIDESLRRYSLGMKAEYQK